jgi:hypothetical protein
MAFTPPFDKAPATDNASGRGITRHSPMRATEPGMSSGSGTRPPHRFGTSAANSSQRPYAPHQPPGPTASSRKQKPAPRAGRQSLQTGGQNASGRDPRQLNR